MTETILQSDQCLEEVRNNYELLLQKISRELDTCKKEQSEIKGQLLTVIENNNRVNPKIDIIQPATSQNWETTHQYEQLTEDAISNLTKQVQHLKEERSTIKQLWKTSQDTIANLETEIQNYRRQLFKPSAFTEIKDKYCSTIKSLENFITNQKNELSQQANTIRILKDDKSKFNDRIKELQAVILEKENKLSDCQQLEKINTSLKQKLQLVLQSNSELEMSTTLAKGMIDERFVREKNALEKLQEALLIAETAVAEKEEALKRELVIKEECENLATTIGQVMEEAARKVERNVGVLRTQYEEKEKVLIKKHNEAISEMEKQTVATRGAEARCIELEQKLKDIIKENSKLDNDLQLASKAIVEIELKLEATENLLKEDKKSDMIIEEREHQLRQYIENNHQLKERWKNTIEDVTKKFGNEIKRLQKENSDLRAQIHAQRLKANTTNY